MGPGNAKRTGLDDFQEAASGLLPECCGDELTPQDCVRRRAVLATSRHPKCESEEMAEKAVNEVFESCFADTRPFDDARCNSSDRTRLTLNRYTELLWVHSQRCFSQACMFTALDHDIWNFFSSQTPCRRLFNYNADLRKPGLLDKLKVPSLSTSVSRLICCPTNAVEKIKVRPSAGQDRAIATDSTRREAMVKLGGLIRALHLLVTERNGEGFDVSLHVLELRAPNDGDRPRVDGPDPSKGDCLVSHGSHAPPSRMYRLA